MWNYRAFIALVIAVLFFPVIAWANPKPSFDCAKASSFAEKAICSNDELAQLDVRMSKAYKAQLAASSNITSAKATQRAWVKKREACGSVACIRSLYAARIPELGGGIVVAAANNADEPAGTFVVANTLPPDDYLSLRTEPSTKIGSRITKMANGTELKVLDRRSDGWWRVEIVATGQRGWASSGSSKKYIVWKPSTKTASSPSTTSAKAAADAKAEADARAARNAKAIADAKAAKAAAKIAADAKAAKLAADKAREAAAAQAEKDQAIRLISAALGNPDPADLFVFLNQGGNAPNLAKNLDGELVSATGTLSVCHTDIASPYSGERGDRYRKLVAEFLGAALPSDAASSTIDLAHCGANAPIDAVYFQLGTLASAPDTFVSYLKANSSAHLIQNGSFTLTDAENAEAVFQAEKEKEIADKIAAKARALSEIRAGTEEGYGFITISGSNAPLCYFNGGALSSSTPVGENINFMIKNILADLTLTVDVAKLNTSLNGIVSLDAVYIALTRMPAQCGWVFGNRTSLQKIVAALDRDGVAYETLPYWGTDEKLSPLLGAAIAQKKADDERKAAKEKADNDKKAAEAKICRSTNLKPCTEAEICKQAVTQQDGATVWGNEDFQPWVREAKARGYDCGAQGDYVVKPGENIDISLRGPDASEDCLKDYLFMVKNAIQLGWIEDRKYLFSSCGAASSSVIAFNIPGQEKTSWIDGFMLVYDGDVLRLDRGMVDDNPLCYDFALSQSYRGGRSCSRQ